MALLHDARDRDGLIWTGWAALMLVDGDQTNSAIAYALNEPSVWAEGLRWSLRDRARGCKTGVELAAEDQRSTGTDEARLVRDAEQGARAAGGDVVRESHVACALAGAWRDQLTGLGIRVDAMLEAVTRREQEQIGDSRDTTIAADALGGDQVTYLQGINPVEIEATLGLPESSGRVDRKRSLLNADQGILARQEVCAVALVNGNPETPVYMQFGVEDDGTVVGEVNQQGRQLGAKEVIDSQRRFVSRLQNCRPPVVVRWHCVERVDKRVWIACMWGRTRGTAVQTVGGAYPYRSGEDTFYADMDTLVAWRAERPPQTVKMESTASSKIIVEVHPGSLHHPLLTGGQAQEHVIVTVYNQGERPVRLVSAGLKLSNGHTLVQPLPLPWQPQFPFDVTDREPFNLLFELSQLRENLRVASEKAGEPVRIVGAWARDAANRTYEVDTEIRV